MKRLGAIIAGGKATRFGADKAAALLNGQPLIEHVADGLRNQVDALLICGREWPGMDWIEDRPARDMGPLAGLNAALHYAQQNGFDEVATAGCDALPIAHFPSKLDSARAFFVEKNYLSGLWPVGLASLLEIHLSEQENHSMRGWIARIGARPLPSTGTIHNLNTPWDLAKYAAQRSNIGIR